MFSTGVFLDRLKIAKVKPLFKKKIMNQVCKTIGLFPYYHTISKIFKKSIYLQTYNTLLRIIYSIKVNMVFVEVFLRSSLLWRSLVRYLMKWIKVFYP